VGKKEDKRLWLEQVVSEFEILGTLGLMWELQPCRRKVLIGQKGLVMDVLTTWTLKPLRR
jgi:hypothetical protein